MDSLRRSIFNLRRTLFVAALVAIGVMLWAAVVVLGVRAAEDPGAYLLRALTIVGALVAAAVVCRLLGRPLPRRVVLELDLGEIPPEKPGDGPLAALGALGGAGKALTLRQMVETIDEAATDKRVRALIVYVGFGPAGLASVQELRDAVTRFRAAEKATVAFADSFGELGGGNGAYYFASAFDEIVLQPGGDLGLVGLHRDVNFVRRALDKAGVEVLVERRHEYKNAANQLVETGFTPPHREAMERLLDSQWAQIVVGIADARGMAADAVQAAADRGPLFAEEALAAGLVTRVGFRDDAVQLAKDRAGPGAELRWLGRYRRLAVKSRRGRTRVAVVTAVGAIERRKRGVNPLTPSGTIAADVTAAAIRKAVANKQVKAVLLRVSSPGGSAVASETIWREVVRARESGKPVVVSMGDVAASGGYYISAAANRIVAQPGTVTGSIGVIAQKPVLAGAKDRLGIDVESLRTAANAAMFSLNRPFEDHEHERFTGWLDHVYDDFVGKVAAGRGSTTGEVHAVAKGRVWTGADAADRGLVDDLGGYRVALAAVRSELGVAADERLRLVDFPKTSPLARLRPGAGRSSEDPKALVAATLRAVEPILRALGLIQPQGVLHAGLEPDDWKIS